MIRWIVATLVVFALAAVTWWQVRDGKEGNIRKELVLHIGDTSRVYFVDILHRDGERIQLRREDKTWTINGEPARVHAVNNLLGTIHDQRVSALIPDNALKNVVRDLGSNGVRFDVKDKNGESMLVFYVGGVTPDERGTLMIREDSEWPVIVNIPGFEGSLRSRYIMSRLDWSSRQLLRPIRSIQSLTLDYPARQEESLVMEKTEDGYQLKPLYQSGAESLPVHPFLLDAYLEQLNQLFAEAVLDGSKRPLLDASTPFCTLTVEDEMNQVQKLEFYPTVWIDYQEDGLRPDRVERYYTDYNDRSIFLTQHLLMQKIFTGYEHFVSLKDFGQ
ncbi:MAG TPA: hypothetical protein VKZ54_01080 [Membranihabitans sp.]|nr:hypothetical protein [Membranihabitans sp.]